MAKLTVKNVGPIREAEVEVKKHTVFIGPQGSGKSTLAKLIAIGGDTQLFPGAITEIFLEKYGISTYISTDTKVDYLDDLYSISFENNKEFIAPKVNDRIESMYEVLARRYIDSSNDLSNRWIKKLSGVEAQDVLKNFDESKSAFLILLENLLTHPSIYIPAERTIISLLSYHIWGIVSSGADLPDIVTQFGSSFEFARNYIKRLEIPYLDILYSLEAGSDMVYSDKSGHVILSKSASGYQSIIPLLLVVEHQRRQSQRHFIIEEPELNLFPTAQKDLIYNLMGGLDPTIDYKEAEWVITTHSPYVLTSFNTLILAHKVAQKSDELRAEVEKIIPSRCWINPDEFAAYYVDKGTVRSIMGEKTGLIADSELDNVSEDFAGEQDQLLNLYRSVPSA
ncbi:AAA family ATPase [Spirosoma luteum]|uniref:AAA family ATPase n=1 Tax=Spirosoma luteum TaxID=431553 RepID=UPI000378D647|nr:AAA family ATPase [Spirosoma luteum]